MQLKNIPLNIEIHSRTCALKHVDQIGNLDHE